MFKCNSSICLSNILGKVSESEILSFYLNINQVPCVIPSPLRKDKNPAFGLYSPDGKKVFNLTEIRRKLLCRTRLFNRS